MQKHTALINFIEQNTFDSYHATLSTLDFLNRFPLLTSNLYILKERNNLTRQQQLYTKNSIGLQQLDPGSQMRFNTCDSYFNFTIEPFYSYSLVPVMQGVGVGMQLHSFYSSGVGNRNDNQNLYKDTKLPRDLSAYLYFLQLDGINREFKKQHFSLVVSKIVII